MMYPLVFDAALAVYLLSTIFFMIALFISKVRPAAIATWILALAFVIHGCSFIVRYSETGYSPLLAANDTLSFFAWVVTGIYLLMQVITKTRLLGAFVAPIVTIAMFIAWQGTPGHIGIPPILRGSLVVVHVALTVAGEALFVLASAAGAMYLLQDLFLKKRKAVAFARLFPSLRDLDRINHVCVLWGFPFLTFGVIAGSLWARTVWGSHWQWDPRQVWTLIVWATYAVLLHQRLAIGWKGHKAAVYSLAAFVMLLASLIVVRGFLPSAHTFV
jgi:cytochrome c-type biogenesis protein CcsB